MLDLASLPRRAFAGGLEYNLERLGSVPKVYDHFLSAVCAHLEADAVWLRRLVRERRLVCEDYAKGTPKHRDGEVTPGDGRARRSLPPRDSPATRRPSSGARVANRQASELSHTAPRLRNPSPGRRLRQPHDPRAPWPQRREHHHDLLPRVEPRRPRRPNPPDKKKKVVERIPYGPLPLEYLLDFSSLSCYLAPCAA